MKNIRKISMNELEITKMEIEELKSYLNTLIEKSYQDKCFPIEILKLSE